MGTDKMVQCMAMPSRNIDSGKLPHRSLDERSNLAMNIRAFEVDQSLLGSLRQAFPFALERHLEPA